MEKKRRSRGIQAALASAIFLGMAPIFGKEAILFGFSPIAVVVLRTGLATLLLVGLMAVFNRQFFYIYPVGLAGCFLAGFINGLGSVFYYIGLSRINASIGQLIYSFYPLFVAFWLLLDRQSIQKLTVIRLLVAIPGVALLVSQGQNAVDWVGAVCMLLSAILYALHLIINQRILFEVPAQTVTLYTLISMTLTVLLAFLIFDRQLPQPAINPTPVIALAFITFFSRITLFMGVKHLGGMQTAILGLGELLVTVFLAHWWLSETLTPAQWIGAAFLAISLFLVGFDRHTPEKRRPSGWLSWLNPPQMDTHDLHWNS